MSPVRPFILGLACAVIFHSALIRAGLAAPPAYQVRVTPDESARRVEVTVDGQLFTSYIWPGSLTKPVLYPIISSAGRTVTRGFPLDPRPGERTDHPHHAGLWFSYGDVNGVDFWNNSTTLPAAERAKMGTIAQRRIVGARSGPGRGELKVETDWIMPDRGVALREETTFVFRASKTIRTIDRATTLTATTAQVVFNDNKEGAFGMRVARWLEQPETKAEVFTDANGATTEVKHIDDSAANGEYLSSEGLKGDAVWGTRGRWCLLHGRTGTHEVTLAIIDHPGNPGFPTYWHARGYGLFAANTLGQKALSAGKDELHLTLKAGESATFRYRVLVIDGPASNDQIEEQYQAFSRNR